MPTVAPERTGELTPPGILFFRVSQTVVVFRGTISIFALAYPVSVRPFLYIKSVLVKQVPMKLR
jgi:hypothetical protein